MSVFLIANIKVTDDSWIPDYAANVRGIVAKHGGKYLSRSGNIGTIKGKDTGSTLIAIIEFPTRFALDQFVGGEAERRSIECCGALFVRLDNAPLQPFVRLRQLREKIRSLLSLLTKGISWI